MAFAQGTRWNRLYRPGPIRVLLMGVAALATVTVTVAGSVVVFSAHFLGERLVLATILTVAVVSALWYTGRVLSAGVWVSDWGLRITTVKSSRRVPWSEVNVERRSAPTDAVWCTSTGSVPWRTPVHDRSLDFVGRAEAYDIAANALVDWWQGHRG